MMTRRAVIFYGQPCDVQRSLRRRQAAGQSHSANHPAAHCHAATARGISNGLLKFRCTNTSIAGDVASVMSGCGKRCFHDEWQTLAPLFVPIRKPDRAAYPGLGTERPCIRSVFVCQLQARDAASWTWYATQSLILAGFCDEERTAAEWRAREVTARSR